MFPPELIAVIKHLITSREVIGVTVFLVLFFSLVFYVARPHQRKPKSNLVLPLKKPKKEKGKKAPVSDDVTDDDELGLEEQ